MNSFKQSFNSGSESRELSLDTLHTVQCNNSLQIALLLPIPNGWYLNECCEVLLQNYHEIDLKQHDVGETGARSP